MDVGGITNVMFYYSLFHSFIVHYVYRSVFQLLRINMFYQSLASRENNADIFPECIVRLVC